MAGKALRFTFMLLAFSWTISDAYAFWNLFASNSQTENQTLATTVDISPGLTPMTTEAPGGFWNVFERNRNTEEEKTANNSTEDTGTTAEPSRWWHGIRNAWNNVNKAVADSIEESKLWENDMQDSNDLSPEETKGRQAYESDFRASFVNLSTEWNTTNYNQGVREGRTRHLNVEDQDILDSNKTLFNQRDSFNSSRSSGFLRMKDDSVNQSKEVYVKSASSIIFNDTNLTGNSSEIGRLMYSRNAGIPDFTENVDINLTARNSEMLDGFFEMVLDLDEFSSSENLRLSRTLDTNRTDVQFGSSNSTLSFELSDMNSTSNDSHPLNTEDFVHARDGNEGSESSLKNAPESTSNKTAWVSGFTVENGTVYLVYEDGETEVDRSHLGRELEPLPVSDQLPSISGLSVENGTVFVVHDEGGTFDLNRSDSGRNLRLADHLQTSNATEISTWNEFWALQASGTNNSSSARHPKSWELYDILFEDESRTNSVLSLSRRKRTFFPFSDEILQPFMVISNLNKTKIPPVLLNLTQKEALLDDLPDSMEKLASEKEAFLKHSVYDIGQSLTALSEKDKQSLLKRSSLVERLVSLPGTNKYVILPHNWWETMATSSNSSSDENPGTSSTTLEAESKSENSESSPSSSEVNATSSASDENVASFPADQNSTSSDENPSSEEAAPPFPAPDENTTSEETAESPSASEQNFTSEETSDQNSTAEEAESSDSEQSMTSASKWSEPALQTVNITQPSIFSNQTISNTTVHSTDEMIPVPSTPVQQAATKPPFVVEVPTESPRKSQPIKTTISVPASEQTVYNTGSIQVEIPITKFPEWYFPTDPTSLVNKDQQKANQATENYDVQQESQQKVYSEQKIKPSQQETEQQAENQPGTEDQQIYQANQIDNYHSEQSEQKFSEQKEQTFHNLQHHGEESDTHKYPVSGGNDIGQYRQQIPWQVLPDKTDTADEQNVNQVQIQTNKIFFQTAQEVRRYNELIQGKERGPAVFQSLGETTDAEQSYQRPQDQQKQADKPKSRGSSRQGKSYGLEYYEQIYAPADLPPDDEQQIVLCPDSLALPCPDWMTPGEDRCHLGSPCEDPFLICCLIGCRATCTPGIIVPKPQV